MDTPEEVLNGLSQELRRGTIVLCVLSQLTEPRYGYSLVQRLCKAGIPAEAGTLYPLLRRLEKQALLTSEWETGGSKPRKYYLMTEAGRRVYKDLCRNWREMSAAMDRMIGMESGEMKDE